MNVVNIISEKCRPQLLPSARIQMSFWNKLSVDLSSLNLIQVVQMLKGVVQIFDWSSRYHLIYYVLCCLLKIYADGVWNDPTQKRKSAKPFLKRILLAVCYWVFSCCPRVYWTYAYKKSATEKNYVILAWEFSSAQFTKSYPLRSPALIRFLPEN